MDHKVSGMFDRLNLAPAYQVVSNAIESEILAGRFKPGDLIPPEVDLAAQFGVNRSTVREGLRLLEQNGLVARKNGKRLQVTVPRTRDLASRMTRAMIMHEITFRELWDLAVLLEPAAATAASQVVDEEALATLEANLEETERALAEGRSILALDMAFHNLIADYSRNRALTLAREPVGMLLLPAFEAVFPLLPNAGTRLVEAHRIILDALRTGDGERAGEWMRKHIVDLKRGYEIAGVDADKPIERRVGGDPHEEV